MKSIYLYISKCNTYLHMRFNLHSNQIKYPLKYSLNYAPSLYDEILQIQQGRSSTFMNNQSTIFQIFMSYRNATWRLTLYKQRFIWCRGCTMFCGVRYVCLVYARVWFINSLFPRWRINLLKRKCHAQQEKNETIIERSHLLF